MHYPAGFNLATSFLALSDVDGDGDLDVAVNDTGAMGIGVSAALNDGKGHFTKVLTVPMPVVPERLVVGDVKTPAAREGHGSASAARN